MWERYERHRHLHKMFDNNIEKWMAGFIDDPIMDYCLKIRGLVE